MVCFPDDLVPAEQPHPSRKQAGFLVSPCRLSGPPFAGPDVVRPPVIMFLLEFGFGTTMVFPCGLLGARWIPI
jgi:hypothetical protein